MPIVHCPLCAGSIEQTPASGGQIVSCPYCWTPFQMPAAVAEALPEATPILQVQPGASQRPSKRIARLALTQKQRDDATNTWIALGIFLAIITTIMASCGGFAFISSGPNPAAQKLLKEAEIEGEVVAMARDACRAKMTYPKTAHFHWDYTIQKEPLGEGTWHVRGNVDVMNSLGAKPTMEWSAIVELVDPGTPRQYKIVAADVSP